MSRTIVICSLAVIVCCPPWAAAQDRDSDGLPDHIETQLGTNPDLDEALQVVIDDKTRQTGDRPGPTAPDIDKVYFGHVAEDRYVWKITFAEDYPPDDTIFHLYCDIDNDTTTGRQEADWVRGVDIMYSLVDSKDSLRVINPAVRKDRFMPVRMVVEGNAIYICDDLSPDAMTVRDGNTDFRMYVLSQVRTNQSDGDSTVWIDCRVPVYPEREAPEMTYPRPENFEALTMPDFSELTYRLWQQAGTIRLLPADAAIEGYTLLMSDEFEGPIEEQGSVTWRCPASGEYHIGLVLQDNAAQLEGLDLAVNGKRIGTVLGTNPTTRQVLYYTSRPQALEQGDAIRLSNAAQAAKARFTSVCMLAEEPSVPPLRIENITAWHMPDEPGERRQRVMVAWTTNRPASGSVHYSLAGPEAFEQNGTLEEGRGAVNNHFVILPPELRASGYQLAITCVEPPQDTYEAMTAAASYTVWMEPRQHYAGPPPEADLPTGIGLTVHEPTGLDRSAWPVTSGVPLPHGLVTNPASCRIVDASGAPVPAQFSALSWWPDGIWVKWLQVDLLADTRAGEDTLYTLEFTGTVPEPQSRVRVDAGGIVTTPEDWRRPAGVVRLPVTVDTGALRLQLAQGGFAPFSRVTVGDRAVSAVAEGQGGFEITDADGKVYSSALAEPEAVIVESEGPLRATLCVRGKLVAADGAAYMRYLCRLHFFAGRPYVRTVFSLDNDVSEPDMNLFSSVRLRVPAALSGATVLCGADDGTVPLPVGGRLLQDEDNHFAAATVEGKRAAGWLLAESAAGATAVTVRDFWQRYPKGFATDAGGIDLQLHPALLSGQYAGASEDDVNKLYFWCDEGRYRVRTGVRLTSEFAVDFAPEVTEGEYLSAELWQKPLYLACTPDWYCQSGAFGPMAPRRDGAFEPYERSMDAAFHKFLERREAVREYGFMNYGDWFGERKFNWGNQEYDTQWALAAGFARTGNLDMLRRAESAARHNADIDTTHHWPDPRQVGSVYTHCIGHTGGYFGDDWKEMGFFNRGPRDTGHTWAQGHFYLYALTGEPTYLETGRLVADWLVSRTTDFGFYSERNVGWPLVAMVGGYNVTGNPVYLNAAKLMADGALWRMHPDRRMWGHFLDPNECKHQPRCWGSKPFMTGVLLHGLKMYDLAQPREDIKQAIVDNCDFLWRETYIPADMGFCYSQCTTFASKGGTWTLSLVGDGLAYGCLLDPERRHRDRLLEATSAHMYRSPVDSFGKTFTQGLCFAPQMLHDLSALGLTEIPQPPDKEPARPVEPPLGGVPMVQGEDFSAQGGGEVQIRTDKAGVVGKAISHWDDEGHWLRWELDADRDGKYWVVVRYCTPNPVQRAAEVDGAEALPQTFEATGGFGADPSDWRHAPLRGADGEPLVLDLKTGKHTIVLTNTDGQGMNVDYIALVPAGE